MALFEDLVTQIDQRFGLHDKTPPFLSLLLTHILGPASGGIHGLITRLKSAGFELTLDRQPTGRDQAILATRQVETALGGREVLKKLANQMGIQETRAALAAGVLIPRMATVLAPGGKVPAEIPAEVEAYIQKFAPTVLLADEPKATNSPEPENLTTQATEPPHPPSQPLSEDSSSESAEIATPDPSPSEIFAPDASVNVDQTPENEQEHQANPESLNLSQEQSAQAGELTQHTGAIIRTVVRHERPVWFAEPELGDNSKNADQARSSTTQTYSLDGQPVHQQSTTSPDQTQKLESANKQSSLKSTIPLPPPADESAWVWYALPFLGMCMLWIYVVKSFALPLPVSPNSPELRVRNAQIAAVDLPLALNGPGKIQATTPTSPPLTAGVTPHPETVAEPLLGQTTSPSSPSPGEHPPTVSKESPDTNQPEQKSEKNERTPGEPAGQSAVRSRLSVERLEIGRVHAVGLVPSPEIESKLRESLSSVFGDTTLIEITVDPHASAPLWLDKVTDVLKLLGTDPKSALVLEGSRFSIGGKLSESEKKKILDAVKALYGSAFEIQ